MADTNNTQHVSVGKGVVGGYIFSAPIGTALPTDYSTALANTYVNLGYVTDDGATFSTDVDSDEFKDLNGDVIATSASSRTRTLNVQFAEVKADTLKEVFGQTAVTVAAGGDITINHSNADMPHRVVVMELVLRDGRKWRRILKDAQITEWGDLTVLYSDLVTFDVTYTLNGSEPIVDYIQAPVIGG